MSLRTRLVTLALLPAVAALALAGCGPKVKPILIKVDTGIYTSIKAIHETAVVLGTAKVITPQQELAVQQAILPVTQLGQQATRVLAAWTSGPTPPELQQLVTEMGRLTQQIATLIPMPDQAKAALLEKIAIAQQAIAAVLLIVSAGGAA